ncbi:MAG: TetR family transcriptional regulator [Clostridia bacterium]|nr:TetR family transcriptional regulator [Clostridia bacterium]MBR6480000.1 TetR family transcriptional regulator [Clostridia bacterium]MBR6511987.1 TetR family transcriptional regulator [Clostridia bacterium]
MPYRTKNDILVAFNVLAEKKGFERITVQMIADEAGISRATFYRYFKDKYDVMNFNYTKFIEEYLFAGKVQTLEDFFFIMATTGTEYFRNKMTLFSSTGPNSFHHYIYESSYGALRKILFMRGKRELTEREKMQYQFLCHGITYYYEEWLLGHYPNISPRDAAIAISELFPPEFQGNLWQIS